MKVAELNKRIDKLIVALGEPTLDIIERVGLNMKGEIVSRIVNTGNAANGSPFPPYTPSYLQFKIDVGRYRGHVDLQLGNYSINKRIEAVEKRRKNNNQTLRQFQELGGVKQTRKRKGKTKAELNEIKRKRRTAAIPQGSTLWRSIGVIEKNQSGGKLMVKITATDELNLKKLDKLSQKRGDVLAANIDEQLNASVKFTTEFEKLVKGIFAE